MEINLLTASNMPEGAIVSMRTGSNVRQAPASSGRSFVFPTQLTDQPLKVQILKPIGTAYVAFKPGEEQYKVSFPPFEGLEMACEVQVRTSDDSYGPPKKPAATTPAKDARNYLESHQVVAFLQASLEALIKERPDDPYAYLGRHFCSGYRPNDWRTGAAPVAADPTGNVDIKHSAEDPIASHKLGAPGAQATQQAPEARFGDSEILSLSLNLRPGTVPEKGTIMVNTNNVQRPESQTLKPQDVPGKPQDHVPTGDKGPVSARAEPLPRAPQQPTPAEPKPRAFQPPALAQPLKETSPLPRQKQPGALTSSDIHVRKDGKKDCICCAQEKPIPTAEEEEAALTIQRKVRSKGFLETRGERSWPEAPTGPKCFCCPDGHHEAKPPEREPFGAPAPPGLEGKDVPRPLISPRVRKAPPFG